MAHKALSHQIGWLYDIVLWSLAVLIDLFFREVHPRGSWKVPKRGPIILVAAPHANQVCPRLVDKCRSTSCYPELIHFANRMCFLLALS